MGLFDFNPVVIFTFLMTFIRISIVLFLMPFFSGDFISGSVKAIVCLILTLVIWSNVPPVESLPLHPLGFALIVLGEVLIGITLSLCISFIFAGIQTGGQLISFQMGFSMLSLADPLGSGTQIAVTSHLLYMIALLTFLLFDGHIILIYSFTESFVLVPPGMVSLKAPLVKEIIVLSSGMFVLAVKIVAPVLAALFMVEIALALMARAAPQMNLLTLGFPIKIVVGFSFLFMLFDLIKTAMNTFITDLSYQLIDIMRALGS